MTGIDDLRQRMQAEIAANRQADPELEEVRLTKTDLTARLAELRRLAILAAHVAPHKKNDSAPLTPKDMDMILDLLARIGSGADELRDLLSKAVELREVSRAVADGYRLNAVDLDVISALTNLGVAKSDAETAVRMARAGDPNLAVFEDLFRTALQLVKK